MTDSPKLPAADAGKKDVKKSHEYDIGCVPSKFWFGFIGSHLIVPIICAFTHVKVKPDMEFVNHEGPIIILANHESYLDPMIINRLTKARPANFVTGEFVFRVHGWGHWFKLGGAIPKKQFVVDTVAVKAMMRVMKRNGILIIFPEATRHVDGKSIAFDDGVAKLAQKSKASVYIAHIHGAYMSWPRWSRSGMRKGKITAEFVRKIYSDEVASMSASELQEQILSSIDYNENDWIRANPRKYRSSKPASGLQNIAYACPRCGKEFTMRYMNSGKHDMIQCNNCGNAAKILPTGLLAPADPQCVVYDDLHKWADWERDFIATQVQAENFQMELNADLFKVYDAFIFAKTGSGKITINNKEIIYEGTECDACDGIPYKKGKPLSKYKGRDLETVTHPTRVVFEIDTMKGLVASYGKYFEIYDKNGQLYRFYVDGQQVFKVHEIVALLGKK